MPHPLLQLLTDSVIRQNAGDDTYRRGHEYYAHGHVESLRTEKTGIHAVVRGQYDYDVTIFVAKGALKYGCDCPIAGQRDFCKHCVAASLAFLLDHVSTAKQSGLSPQAAAAAFAKAPSVTIAKTLAEWARDDTLLSQRLIQYAARETGPEKAVSDAIAAFRKAAKPPDFIGYEEAAGYAGNVHGAIDAFQKLIDRGHAEQVVDLCEEALRILEAGAEMIEDDGEVSELYERLLELHLTACRQSVSDPVALAHRLFHLEIDSELDAFAGTAVTYAEILGTSGIDAFRTLAENPDYSENAEIEGILKSVARASGNVDELVAILSRDAENSYAYRQIAEALQQAGRHDDMLHWIEKGLTAFPTDYALRAATANEYHRRGEHGKAVKIIWPVYTESPNLTNYKLLRDHAARTGEWPEWRDHAIGLIRQRLAAAKGKLDHSALVEIFLYENNGDEAWREAQAGNCHSHFWMPLAEAREKDHPGDAAPIYLREAENAINNSYSSDYNKPVELLLRAAKVMKRIDASPAFARQLDALRAKYKIKRNFIKLLDKHRRELEQP